jgi:MtN3 and saliva related transmembrane protein
MIDVVETIGSVAAILTTGCYMPQVLHTYKTKNVAGISLGMYLLLSTGIAFWLAYGMMLHSLPLIFSNIVTLLMIGSIIAMKLRYAEEETQPLRNGG